MSDLDIKIDWKKARSNISKDRYKVFRNYTFDRFIFSAAFWIILLGFFFVAQHFSFNLDYYKCEGGHVTPGEKVEYDPQTSCKNPFFESTSWKNEEFIPVGEYGVNPDRWYGQIKLFLLSVLAVAALLNHAFHNLKGFNKTKKKPEWMKKGVK